MIRFHSGQGRNKILEWPTDRMNWRSVSEGLIQRHHDVVHSDLGIMNGQVAVVLVQEEKVQG